MEGVFKRLPTWVLCLGAFVTVLNVFTSCQLPLVIAEREIAIRGELSEINIQRKDLEQTVTYKEEQLVRKETIKVPIYRLTEPYFQNRTPGTYRVAVLPFGDYVPGSDDLGAGFSTKFEFELMKREAEMRRIIPLGAEAVVSKYIEVVGYKELLESFAKFRANSDKVDQKAEDAVQRILNDFQNHVRDWFKRNAENRYEILSRTALPFLLAEKELGKIIEQAKVLRVDGLIDGFVYQNSFIIKVIDTYTTQIVFINEYKGTDERTIKVAVDDFYYNLVRVAEQEIDYAIVKVIEKERKETLPGKQISVRQEKVVPFQLPGKQRFEGPDSIVVLILLIGSLAFFFVIPLIFGTATADLMGALLALMSMALGVYLWAVTVRYNSHFKLISYKIDLTYQRVSLYSGEFDGSPPQVVNMNSYAAGVAVEWKKKGKQLVFYGNSQDQVVQAAADYLKSREPIFLEILARELEKQGYVGSKNQELLQMGLTCYRAVVSELSKNRQPLLTILATWSDSKTSHVIATYTPAFAEAAISLNLELVNYVYNILAKANIDFFSILEQAL